MIMCRPCCALPIICICLTFIASRSPAGEAPTREQALEAVKKAAAYFHKYAAAHGGYVWKCSGNGELREAEGTADEATIWVQPPGTPAVGEAFLQAYETTKNSKCLQAAIDAANALVEGQLQSGGWYYGVYFEGPKRDEFYYRNTAKAKKLPARDDTPYPGGLVIWRQRKFKGNITLMDDDVTPAALRFLMQVDKALEFKNKAIHEAVQYGLDSVLVAQYPNGAWSHNYDRYGAAPPSEKYYPVIKASFPKEWSRKWTKDWTGCYMLNDRITLNGIKTMLLAHRIYGDKKYLESAHRGGDFLILAQLPDPQPAWAQQYNPKMQPVWDRSFEPPAITGLESQDVLETLMLLYRQTGEQKYLAPIPKALAYLKKSQLPSSKLARFYELETNRPIYFDRNYQITYDSKNAPKHYGFIVDSRLKQIDAEYQTLKSKKLPAQRSIAELRKQAQAVIAQMNGQGAWIEKGTVRNPQGRKQVPESGVLYSQTFIDNIDTLCRFIEASGSQ